MLTPQFILVPLAAMLAGLGLTHGLEPLNLLQARLRARAPGDLSPVDQEQAPAEIVPLIDAMNGLLAQQAQFSATQRQFVANAAHQLKTPLAGIRTQAELALRERDPKQTEASLQQLVRGTDRATRLVTQMLALARAESSDALYAPTKQTLDLNTLTELHVGQRVPDALQLGLDLGLENNSKAILLQADPVLLDELINNLLDNALIYTPAGGWITMRTGQAQDKAWLEIEDNGPGIPAEHKARIFDRFYRIMGNQADGSGLGLAIVREIAEIHGASIDFMPLTGGQESGLRLRVSFPLSLPWRA
jgi:two-component system sensor histidine kinase TctE